MVEVLEAEQEQVVPAEGAIVAVLVFIATGITVMDALMGMVEGV